PMADYYSLIAGAVYRLPSQTDEARHALYEHARTALQERLRALHPPISAAELGNEEARLEAAISRVESELLFSIMQRFASEGPIRSTPISNLISSTLKEFVRSVGEKLNDNITITRDGLRSSEATKVVSTGADITARLAQCLEFAQRTQLKAKDVGRQIRRAFRAQVS
ncbi:MAG: hypothetical protein WAK55_31420, partial [Xanthobacteraceae bacterium]